MSGGCCCLSSHVWLVMTLNLLHFHRIVKQIRSEVWQCFWVEHGHQNHLHFWFWSKYTGLWDVSLCGVIKKTTSHVTVISWSNQNSKRIRMSCLDHLWDKIHVQYAYFFTQNHLSTSIKHVTVKTSTAVWIPNKSDWL